MFNGEEENTDFISLWLFLTGARTHDITHSRRAHLPLHHQCGSYSNKLTLIRSVHEALFLHGCCNKAQSSMLYWHSVPLKPVSVQLHS